MTINWAGWVERMLPPGIDEEAKLRSRFLVRGWFMGAGFSVCSSVLYALAGLWSQVAITLLLALSGVGVLWLHRRGVRFEWLAHASLGFGSLTFGVATLAQRPADYSSLALLLIIPLLAGLLLGHRRALPWLFITIAWAGFIFTAADRGWLMDYQDPLPTVSHVVNFSMGLLVSWLFTGTFDDLRSKAMARLLEADRARTAFLANISHEIRTPMNGVLGMTEVLLQDQLSPTHREQLRIIQRSGRSLVALINDLLDVSKMEAGKLQLEEADFNLDTVLADVQALMAPAAAGKGVAFHVTKAPDVGARLRGDGRRLSQVLTNLASNAVKFTHAGEVHLEIVRLPDPTRVRCRFTVTDTGVGIPPEVLPRLFNAFEQGDSSTTRRFGGTGLGLALSAELVALMGSRVVVTSRLGEGSRFSFEVAFDEAEGPSGEFPLEVATLGLARLPVLVVDDNPINLKVAMSLVEKAGFRAEGAVNGREALAAVQHHAHAMVLMDCHMPEMDGFEATERIRALSGDVGRTPIVALTASAMPEELAACRRVGMNSVLTKPVTFVALREVLQGKVD